MTPPTRTPRSERSHSAGRRPTASGPGPLAVVCFVGLIAALGVAGWASRNKRAAAGEGASGPAPAEVDPFASVTREAPPTASGGGGRVRETNRAPAGLLDDPLWLGAVQIAQEGYSLRDQAEDSKASGDLSAFAAKAVNAREAFGRAIDASRAFEDRIIDQYGENDRQVRRVARERNKWFDLRAKYRKVKAGQ